MNASKVELDKASSRWSDPDITAFILEKYKPPRTSEPKGQEKPNDYKIVFGDVGTGTSKSFVYNRVTYPSMPVNFKVFNVSEDKFIDFAFLEFDTSRATGRGWFSSDGATKADRIIFLESAVNDTNTSPTWWFYSQKTDTANLAYPVPGDTAIINVKKPFLSNDVLRFVSKSAYIDKAQAQIELDNIKVVPNPYLANALWEPKNPYSSGRGPRSIHFTHLPNQCTIRIFTVSGELVKEIEHESQFS